VGSAVRIQSDAGSTADAKHSGQVIKLLSDLETKGRMARLIVAVKDPLGIKNARKPQTPLLISEVVRVEIQGHALENVTRIPRSALRDNQSVWVLNPKGNLEIRPANVVWRDDQTVLLKDTLDAEDQLIVSDLSGAVAGMALRVPQAEQKDGLGGVPKRESGPAGDAAFMARFDGDKDGKVSKEEFKGPAMMFKMFDKNGDGFVGQDEAPQGAPPGGMPPRG
jgi:hypothetical protein